MSTTGAVSTGNLTTDKVTVRTYIKTAEDGTIKEKRTQAQTADGKNWKKLEDDGFTLFNENEVLRYTTKDKAACETLVPDETQSVYVFQAGVNYIQNSKTSSLCGEIKEGTDTKDIPAEPAYNQETIDMREHINAAPQRTSLSPQDKVLRDLKASGLPLDQIMALVQMIQAQQAAAVHSVGSEQPEGEYLQQEV